MAFQIRDIEQLLEKYDNAQTSLQEEQQLKHYFAQEEVVPHLQHYKAMFSYFQETKTEQFTKDIRLKPKKIRIYKWASVAAVIAIMFSVTFLNKPDSKRSLEDLSEEELLVYNQTKEAFTLLSSRFNQGVNSLNALAIASHNLEKGVKQVGLINEFGKTTNKIFKTN